MARLKGSLNKVVAQYAWRCNKCKYRFTLNIRVFSHSCPKCLGTCDAINTNGIIKK